MAGASTNIAIDHHILWHMLSLHALPEFLRKNILIIPNQYCLPHADSWCPQIARWSQHYRSQYGVGRLVLC